MWIRLTDNGEVDIEVPIALVKISTPIERFSVIS
jgi:hypothetical protein